VLCCSSGSFLNNDERNAEEKTCDSSSDLQAVTDKSDWDALQRYISYSDGADFNNYMSVYVNTTVSDIPIDHDDVAMAGHAVIHYSDVELKWQHVN